MERAKDFEEIEYTKTKKTPKKIGKSEGEQIEENMTPMPPFELNGFRIDTFANESYLIIEAEKLNTGEFYKKELLEKNIAEIAHSLMKTPIDLADFIQYASTQFDGSDAQMSISDDAVITLTTKTTVGRTTRDVHMTIELQPENLPPLEVSKRYFKKVQEAGDKEENPFNTQVIKLFNKVFDHNNKLEEKFKELEEGLHALES